MVSVMFDTHYFVKLMKDRGFSEQQAEAVVQMQSSVLNTQIATQGGLDALRMSTQADLEALRLSLQADLEQHRISTKADLRELELRMTVRLGGMIMALGGVLIAVKYFG